MDSAIGDLSDWVSTMTGTLQNYPEVYEMTEDGIRKVFEARDGAIQEFDMLQSLRKLINNLANLRDAVKAVIAQYWKQGTATSAIVVAVELTLRTFANNTWADQKQQPISANNTSNGTATSATKTSTSSTSSTSASATASPYIIGTKQGTDPDAFRNYVNTLPNGDQANFIQFPNVPWQTCVVNLTVEQAKEVSSQSFVSDVVDIAAAGFVVPARAHPGSSKKRRKSEPPDFQVRGGSDNHLWIISADKQDTINAARGRSRPSYIFDGSLGQGQTIYIIDSGCRLTHTVRQPTAGFKCYAIL